MRATLAKASQDYLKLLAFVQDSPDGRLLEYKLVSQATGVIMNIAGKSKLRRAILRSKREYAVIPTVGYKLAEADMAISILTFRLHGIDTKVRRAERSQVVLQAAFFDQLPPEEQRAVLFVGSVFGAIRQAAKEGTKLYRDKPRELKTGNPVLPDNV